MSSHTAFGLIAIIASAGALICLVLLVIWTIRDRHTSWSSREDSEKEVRLEPDLHV